KKVQFLFAVHCDITVWYMTSVMSPNRSIYPFTPERPRDLSARAPEAAPQESLSYDVPTDLPLLKTSQDEVHSSQYILKAKPQSKSFVCFLLSTRSEEHTSELQSHLNLVCRLLL